MRMHKGIVAGLIAGMLGFGVAALAQSSAPVVSSIGQGDMVQIVPGGIATAQSKYANAGWVGGEEQYSLQVPLTAFAITIPQHTSLMMINPAGTLATGAFTMEANPSDGQRVCIASTQAQTAMTVAGNTGQTITGTAATALVASTRVCYTYIAPSASWFRVQ